MKKETKQLNKLTSLLLVLVLGASGLFSTGGTSAYYNDVESSNENTFAVGSLDFLITNNVFEGVIGNNPGDLSQFQTSVVSDINAFPLQYDVTYVETGGDSEVCDALNIETDRGHDQVLNIFGTTPTEDLGLWSFDISVIGGESLLPNQQCEFDLIFDAEMVGGGGFTDTETMSMIIHTQVPNIVEASISADPSFITEGDSSDLTWDSANATSCTGTNFDTGGATSGTVEVSPIENTDYSVECTGPTGSADDETTITVNPVIVEGGYCGDGVVNQVWEQCDGGNSCTLQCQDVNDNECRELTLAKIDLNNVSNTGVGDMTTDQYLGSGSNMIPDNTWFALYYEGTQYTDLDISGYENVPGLSIQRLIGQIRTLVYGSHSPRREGDGLHGMEHVEGEIEIWQGDITDQVNDTSGNNQYEGPTDGDKEITPFGDEYWMAGGKSNFWATVTVQDDAFYTNHTIDVPICEVPEEGGEDSDIVINEFLPHPDGEQFGFDFGDDSADMPQGEWVELYNNGDDPINVADWYITDASGGVGNTRIIELGYVTPATTIIPSGGYLVVYMNKAVFNNTGDTVKLYNDDDVLIDSYAYSSDYSFCALEPTPNGENTSVPSGGDDCGNQVPSNKSYARIPDGIGAMVDPIPTPGNVNTLDDFEFVTIPQVEYVIPVPEEEEVVEVFTNNGVPVITIIGNNPALVEYAADYSDLGAYVSDDKDHNIGMKTEGEVDTRTLGEYEITYSAVDNDGNTVTETRYVIVYDPQEGIPVVEKIPAKDPIEWTPPVVVVEEIVEEPIVEEVPEEEPVVVVEEPIEEEPVVEEVPEEEPMAIEEEPVVVVEEPIVEEEPVVEEEPAVEEEPIVTTGGGGNTFAQNEM